MTNNQVIKLKNKDLEELTLMCLVEMKKRTGMDIKKIGEDAVKTERIKKYLGE